MCLQNYAEITQHPKKGQRRTPWRREHKEDRQSELGGTCTDCHESICNHCDICVEDKVDCSWAW